MFSAKQRGKSFEKADEGIQGAPNWRDTSFGLCGPAPEGHWVEVNTLTGAKQSLLLEEETQMRERGLFEPQLQRGEILDARMRQFREKGV